MDESYDTTCPICEHECSDIHEYHIIVTSVVICLDPCRASIGFKTDTLTLLKFLPFALANAKPANTVDAGSDLFGSASSPGEEEPGMSSWNALAAALLASVDKYAASAPSKRDSSGATKPRVPLPRPPQRDKEKEKDEEAVKEVPRDLKPKLRHFTVATLVLLGDMRLVLGVLFDVITIPTKDPMFTELRKMGKSYAVRASLGGLSPPHLWLGRVLVKLLTTSEHVGGQTKKNLLGHFQAYQSWDQAPASLVVRSCRTAKRFKYKNKKVWLQLNTILLEEGNKLSVRQTVLNALREMPDTSMMVGRAPAGYKEEQLSQYLVKTQVS